MTTRWTANGLSHDLPPGVVMPGQCEGRDLAIWRSASGKISAWADRCQHRGMRLSHGFVRGETLACIYHGWVYGTSGACRRIPAHPELVPPAAIRAVSFECRESDGVIWVAPLGEASLPPDLSGLQALRSLTFRVARLAADGFSGGDVLRGTVRADGRAVDVALVLQPQSDGSTAVHALCAPDAPGVAVSRWLEGLRRQAEAEAA